MREQFHTLQALRGVACLLVVVFHVGNTEARFGLGFNPLKPTQWFGYAGVDLFFVLSGFIIAATNRHQLGRPARVGKYLFRRVWRIYPTYWAALAVAAGYYAAFAHDPLITSRWATELVDSLLLLPQPGVPRILPVAWTLSYEVMFYLAFAVLFLLPRQLAVPALVAWAGVVIGAAIAGHVPANRFAFLAVSPFVCEFLMGAAVGWSSPRLSGRTTLLLVATAAAWCAIGSAVAFSPDPNWLVLHHVPRVLVFGIPAAVLVYALTGWERDGGELPGRLGWLRSVGDASYSVYLLHIPCLVFTLYLTMLVPWSHRKAPHVAWIAVMLAGSVLPGLLFYRAVERPLMNLVKRRPKPVVEVEAAVEVRRAA